MTGKRRMGLLLVAVWLLAAAAAICMHSRASWGLGYFYVPVTAAILGTLAVLYAHPKEL
jgi:hypothetical protein